MESYTYQPLRFRLFSCLPLRVAPYLVLMALFVGIGTANAESSSVHPDMVRQKDPAIRPSVEYCTPESSSLVQAMEAELGRSMTKLGGGAFETPYFISYLLRERESKALRGKFGALYNDGHTRNRVVAVDLRVGDYAFDSSGIETMDFDHIPDYFPEEAAPLDYSPEALRTTLWLLTDKHFKEAVAGFGRKKGREIYKIEESKVDSLSRQEPIRHCDKPLALTFDHDSHAQTARELSRKFVAHPEIFDAEVRISADKEFSILVNNEGSKLVKERNIYSVGLSAMARAEDGMLLDVVSIFYAPTEEELPQKAELEREVASMMENLMALRKAPVVDPYTGPAILEPEATGVFFHEAIGHRLEGERQSNEREGRTFKGRVGERVIPDFLTVLDDPVLPRYDGIPLNGHYLFDDQAVPAQRVVLIENGILKGYLLSRTPAEGFPISTGHGRSQGVRSPIARMGNLVVISNNGVPYEELKAKLLKKAKDRGEEYGLVIEDISGGSTNTSTYGYQAFKGTPKMVYRVNVKTGARELVRGVEMVGTPLTAINSIAATGDSYGVFNGYCGAESGYVPVSTIAPAALFREVELQRVKGTKEKGPLLSPPQFDQVGEQ